MLTRAYSLLTIKAVDVERRMLSGVATTPTPDRMGDVIEPDGVSFKNPLPLLLYHDSQQPVGTVKLDKPTKDGVTFTAQIPEITEPGRLRDRVEEAWQSIKAKLIRGVSIGFRPLNDAIDLMKDTGGMRFRETEILELSLVAIPANHEATILSIKQFDTSSAVPGGPRVGVSLLPGATGSRTGLSMKTYSERITTWENTRAAKVAEREAIQTKAEEEGRTKNESEQQGFAALTTEIDSIDTELKDLRVLEKAQASMARPVNGESAEAAAASRGGGSPVVTVKDTLPPGIEFARYAMCLARAGGNAFEAAQIAKQAYPDQPRIQTALKVGTKQMQMMMKAAVAAGTTTDPTWAGPLVQYTDFAGDFIDFLRPQTIVGKFGTNGIPSLTRIPFNVRIKGQTSGGAADWVGQGAPKPLTSFDFTSVTLTWAKVANIAVLTEELVRFSTPSAEMLVRNALAKAIIERIDTDFVDPAKALVADVSPASITNGVTAIPSSGTTLAAVYEDVQAIMAPFITANLSPSSGVWIMSPTRALALSLMRNALGQREFGDINMNGGTFQGLPVIVSNYVRPTGSPDSEIVILVNAEDVYLADDGQVTIDMSTEASLQMDDAPTNSVAAGSPLAPVATSVVSLWQTDSVGFRCHRFINWALKRAAGVQYLDNVRWAA